MKTISMDLRQRVIAACGAGHKTKAVADLFKVCPAWVRRLKQRWREEGTLAPRPRGGDQRSSFDAPALEALRRIVMRRPDATLAELREKARLELGVDCGVSSIDRALRRLGLSYKKSRCTPASNSVRTSGPAARGGPATRGRSTPTGSSSSTNRARKQT